MGRWIGALTLALGISAGGMYLGLAGGGPCLLQGEAPGVDTPEMSYYLGNQAFFSGDTEEAARTLRSLQAAGVSPRALCEGMMLKVEVKGESLYLCDPDSLSPPPAFEAWASGLESQAQGALRGMDYDAAESHLRPLLAADPYRVSARGLMIATLRGQGNDAEIPEHGAALVAQSQGRLLAIEVGELHQL